MISAFTSFITANKLFRREDKILLAVSGGMDSVTMTELFHRAGFNFGIAHCNFSLRGMESDADSTFVETLAMSFGVPFFSITFNTSTYAEDHGISIQMAARELRYPWFEAIRKDHGYDYIATAHHLDDQAETFFINLIRGTGISGLHGIIPAQGKLIRPMLFTSRQEIELFVKSEALQYREDSSNASDKYTRNKIRHQLLPVLKAMNPEFITSLTETIDKIRGFEEIGQVAVNKIRHKIMRSMDGQTTMDIDRLSKLHPRDAFAWELLCPFGFSQAQVANILQSLGRESGKTFYSQEYRLIRDRDKLIITRRKDPESGHSDEDELIFIEKGVEQVINPICLYLAQKENFPGIQIPVSKEVASLDFDKLVFPLTLRKWRSGDSFYPFGMQRKQKLSDFFINSKVSLARKENTWLLCSGSKIVWVVGLRIDNRFRITGKTKCILKIRLIK